MKLAIRRIILNAAVLLSLLITPCYAATKTTVDYRITKVVALGSGERWDFVVFDPVGKRVYVAHGDHVTVVDEQDGKVIGNIGTFPGGTHGIAISTATNQGYTDDGKAGVAIAFNLHTLKVVKTIPTATDADAIIREPLSGNIYVINGDSGSITVIDPKTNTSIATIDVGAGLEPGVADGKGALFINGVEKHEIVKIDVKTNTVEAHWPMPTCIKPHGIAIDPETRRLFSTCANKVLVVLDATNGKTIGSIPIGGFSDGAAFDPVRKLIFSSNGDGTLSAVWEKDAQTFDPAGIIKTVPGARTMAIDPKTGRIFFVGADVAKIDPSSKQGARPRVSYVPNSLKLFFLDPIK